jgi:hypothetical protein
MLGTIRREEHGNPSHVSFAVRIGPEALDQLPHKSQGEEADDKKLWGFETPGW